MSTLASVSVVNISRLSNSSLSFPLNDSIYPFSQGLPGSIKSVVTSRSFNHLRTAFEVNSGPLSERMYPRVPLNMNRQNSCSITSWETASPWIRIYQALPDIFINDSEYSECSSFSCSCHHGIIAPDMILTFRPQSDTWTIIQPKASSLGLFLGHLESFPSPNLSVSL